MGPRDLSAYNFYDGKRIAFEFESGITVEGLNVTGIRNLNGKLMLIQFTDCTVSYNDEILFSPEDGDFNFAVGKEIVSAFAGPADYRSFDLITHKSESETIRKALSAKDKDLNDLYESVRQLRHGEITKFSLDAVFDLLKKHHPEDWLLPLEIYEMAKEDQLNIANEVLEYLNDLKAKRPKVAHLIKGGIELLKIPVH